MRRAVFLDRDGVLIEAVIRKNKPYPPSSLETMNFTPGALSALKKLKKAGFLLIVITNQPDVGRGTQDKAVVDLMHARLFNLLPIDDIKVCFTAYDTEECTRRKPKPGMLIEAAREWNIDLSRSIMVGDRWRDIEAGQRAGCQTVFIDNAYDERKPQKFDFCAQSLGDALSNILGN